MRITIYRPIQMKCDFENYAGTFFKYQSGIRTLPEEMTRSIEK
jgi:hypothetical protein